jgi:Ca-activated chloride channel family protein
MSPSLSSSNVEKWRKPLLFGLWAALGTTLFALLGELWLALTVAPPPPPPVMVTPRQAVVLALDTSGSMTGPPFEELKSAALTYIARQDLSRTRIGIVSFNNDSRVESPLTSDATSLRAAVESLEVGGVTRMDLGLSAALSVSPPVPTVPQTPTSEPAEQRSILLFTDGYPQDVDWALDVVTPTRDAALAIRQGGCRLVAIGTSGADGGFLADLTGDPKLVFAAGDGRYADAFKQAETAINAAQGNTLIQSQKQENFDASRELWRTAVWTGLLGIGLSGALLLSQSRYSRGSFGARDALGVGGGLVAGLVAGTVGQFIFMQAGGAPTTIALGRLLGWALAGALVGAGTAPFIPNLSPPRASLAGLLGGLIGALGFMFAALISGDASGRLIGAAIIGFAIGLMVVLAEVAFRKAWLRVSYGPGDSFNVTLGGQPVAVGNDSAQCRILAREVAPVEATYAFETGRAFLEEHSGARHELQPGDTRRYGNVEVTFCTDNMVAKAPVAVPPPPAPPVAPATPPAPAVPDLAPPPIPSTPPPVPVVAAPVRTSIVEGWYLQGPSRIALPNRGTVTVGTEADNTIVISGVEVAAHHAKLTVGAKMLTVRDLGSTGGTFINGKRLEPHVPSLLKVGDRLTMGRLNFILGRID